MEGKSDVGRYRYNPDTSWHSRDYLGIYVSHCSGWILYVHLLSEHDMSIVIIRLFRLMYRFLRSQREVPVSFCNPRFSSSSRTLSVPVTKDLCMPHTLRQSAMFGIDYLQRRRKEWRRTNSIQINGYLRQQRTTKSTMTTTPLTPSSSSISSAC